jgi:putative spermidine/putrescine transport system permease protein
VVIGTAAALSLHRSDFAGKAVLRAILLSPLVTPVIVLAIGIFMVFARWGVAGTVPGLVIAHTVLALPFVIVAVTAMLHGVNPNLELAALGLGARPWRTFRRVTLPLIMPGVVAGAIFAFITSWDEVVIAIFMTTSSLRTIPVLVWGQMRTEISPAIAAVGTILIVISAAGLGAISLLKRKERP